jgi:hypothetical protein
MWYTLRIKSHNKKYNQQEKHHVIKTWISINYSIYQIMIREHKGIKGIMMSIVIKIWNINNVKVIDKVRKVHQIVKEVKSKISNKIIMN